MAVSYLCLLFFLIVYLADLGTGQDKFCREERCGENGPPIRFPFRVIGRQPDYCGYPGFDISCTYWNETILEMTIPLAMILNAAFKLNKSQEFSLFHGSEAPSSTGQNIRLSLNIRDIDYLSQKIEVSTTDRCLLSNVLLSQYITLSNNFPFQLRCQEKNSSYAVLICDSDLITSCVDMVPSNTEIQDFFRFQYLDCTKWYDIESIPDDMYMLLRSSDSAYSSITLTWSKPDCRFCEAERKGCRLNKDGADQHDQTECFNIPKPTKGKPKQSLVMTIGAFVFFSLVVATKNYHLTLDKNARKNRLRIEKFLEDYIAFKASRYTYADVKNITNQFKDKLGQGAYGTVFKGKLSSDILVAVKVLNNMSKGNGEEFINEVATMGRIHHVNVARLVGYCAEGFTRALVYEFLPNDSLEKYLSSTCTPNIAYPSLTWEMMENIALGVAKGIEYLHQGCDQRILHFDIKPHNILLDQTFTPKICDFGLAKLCSKDQSVVSMSTARGTMGYIAPEVFSRDFGNVSYKSDVYSFGILLLEMVGGRKNTIVTKENADEIYYPEWTYNLLEGGDLHEICTEKAEDVKIAKKLAIIGHWCIQWHPVGRPTMKVVVQMLEGKIELTMPPNPFPSIGPSVKMSKLPARRMAFELEVISE